MALDARAGRARWVSTLSRVLVYGLAGVVILGLALGVPRTVDAIAASRELDAARTALQAGRLDEANERAAAVFRRWDTSIYASALTSCALWGLGRHDQALAVYSGLAASGQRLAGLSLCPAGEDPEEVVDEVLGTGGFSVLVAAASPERRDTIPSAGDLRSLVSSGAGNGVLALAAACANLEAGFPLLAETNFQIARLIQGDRLRDTGEYLILRWSACFRAAADE